MNSCSARGSILRLAVVVLTWTGLARFPCSVFADRIVLRNLKIVTDRTVASFDVDGVKLDDGSVLGWDEIERATIDGDKQDAFDKQLLELGGPLYRIRQRLSTG